MKRPSSLESPPDRSLPSAQVTNDPLEVARFLRPQPPIPVPPRTYRPELPGLLAYALLGARVVTRCQPE